MIRWAAFLIPCGVLAAAVAIGPVAGAAQTAPSAGLVGDEEAGRETYVESCRACHSGAIAPTLKGVAGRSVASVPGYPYSEALAAKAGKTWSAQELDAFLADPRSYAAGSKMALKVEDPQKRADLVAYLLTM